jgi:hypothetical protein
MICIVLHVSQDHAMAEELTKLSHPSDKPKERRKEGNRERKTEYTCLKGSFSVDA